MTKFKERMRTSGSVREDSCAIDDRVTTVILDRINSMEFPFLRSGTHEIIEFDDFFSETLGYGSHYCSASKDPEAAA